MLPKLPSLKGLLQLYQVNAAQELSQNFIFSSRTTDRIASFLGKDLSGNLVIEVGCGPGSLTRSIMRKNCPRLYGIEKDRRFSPILDQLADACSGRLRVFYKDALRDFPKTEILHDFNGIGTPLRKVQIIGNLPFNVATPMHIMWLRWLHESEPLFSSAASNIELILTFQKEVAQRIFAQPGSEVYCRLSIISQIFCNVEYLLTVPSTAFTPAPEVDAGVIRLTAKPKDQLQVEELSFSDLEQASRILFCHPNKTLRNNLRLFLKNHHSISHVSDSLYADVPKNHRGRELAQGEFLAVAMALKRQNLLYRPTS